METSNIQGKWLKYASRLATVILFTGGVIFHTCIGYILLRHVRV